MTGGDYIQLAPPKDGLVRIRFSGHFQGRPVVWDASIVTLEQEYRLGRAGNPATRSAGLRPFIEVGPDRNGIRTVRIGLNVERIDEPVILKSIIMIRQYKRLHEGRHEHGEIWSPPAQP
jgi:hypothetical protein